jgi:hypothetical protein
MIASGDEGSAMIAGSVRLAPGLGLTNRFIIDQHFRQRDRLGRLLTALAYNPFAVGIGLDEDTAAFIGPDETVESGQRRRDHRGQLTGVVLLRSGRSPTGRRCACSGCRCTCWWRCDLQYAYSGGECRRAAAGEGVVHRRSAQAPHVAYEKLLDG